MSEQDTEDSSNDLEDKYEVVDSVPVIVDEEALDVENLGDLIEVYERRQERDDAMFGESPYTNIENPESSALPMYDREVSECVVAVTSHHGWGKGDYDFPAVNRALKNLAYRDEGEDVNVVLYDVEEFSHVSGMGRVYGQDIEEREVLSIPGDEVDKVLEVQSELDLVLDSALAEAEEIEDEDEDDE